MKYKCAKIPNLHEVIPEVFKVTAEVRQRMLETEVLWWRIWVARCCLRVRSFKMRSPYLPPDLCGVSLLCDSATEMIENKIAQLRIPSLAEQGDLESQLLIILEPDNFSFFYEFTFET